MARASARGGRRPRPNARQRLAERQRLQQAATVPQEPPKKKTKQENSWEDQLFLSRLRRHMKWVFVLLAVVFALGFVVFGVGTGSNNGSLGSVLRDLFGGSSTHIPTLADAQKKVDEHPDDPTALHELAVAQGNAQQYTAAAATLVKYLKIRQSDAAAVSLLGTMYGSAASLATSQANALSQQGLGSGFDSNACQFQGTSGFLNAACANLVDQAETGAYQAKANTANARAQALYAKQAGAYATLVKLTPGSAFAYKAWGAAAGRGNLVHDEITAYETLLKKFPNDPDASQIKALLAPLKASTNDVVRG